MKGTTEEVERPGQYLLREYMEPNGISANKAARMMGLSAPSVLRLITGPLGVTPQMAIRLSYVFGETPEAWLEREAKYSLWATIQKLPKVREEIDLDELRPLKK